MLGRRKTKPYLPGNIGRTKLHAATRAGSHDVIGREALLRYVLRPPIAEERVELRPDGLVRISLKRAYADGTIGVTMDPLSLLCRLAAWSSERQPKRNLRIRSSITLTGTTKGLSVMVIVMVCPATV